MPAVLRPDQQSVCASGRFRDYGKPDVSGSGGDLPWSARAVPECSDEHVRGTGDATGSGSGGAGGDAGGEPRQAHRAYAGLPESDGNIDAAGIEAQGIGACRAAPGPGGGRSYLRAAACARGTHPLAETTRPLEPGDSY